MISITAAWLAAGLTTIVPMAPPTAAQLASEPQAEAPPIALDTTFDIAAGARVEVDNFTGSVVVRTWDRAAVRVVSSRTEPDRVRIRSAGAVVRIESDSRRGISSTIDYEITIPASAPVRISGPFTDVTIEGAGADVAVETVKGDVRVRGGNGVISLRSVEGRISLAQARGRISVAGVNDGVTITNADGELSIATVNGDIRLDKIRSGSVSASTVNGTLSYNGTIRDQGRYSFTTHNGNLILVLPEAANAAISIATYNGKVESALPVTLTRIGNGQRLNLTIGNGSAQIVLESFNGVVHLRRPDGARD